MTMRRVKPRGGPEAYRSDFSRSHPAAIVFDGRYIQDQYHGIGRYAFQLLLQLARLLPTHRFVVLRDLSLAESRFDWAALEALPNVFVQGIAAPTFSLKEQIAIPFLSRLRGHAVYYTPYFALPWLLHAPSLVTVHDCIFEHNARYMPHRWERVYYKILMRASMWRARVVFVPSRATARDVRHFYGVPARKLVVTPEAADAGFRPMEESDTTRQVRERYGLPDRFVLAVGARRPHKNVGMLVRAVLKLKNAELVFVGNADKRFTDDAANEAAKAGSRVHFLGSVPEADLPVLYNLATVVACPSLIEGFGLPLLEAMSCGTPVVCSDIPVFREVAGDSVIYADPHNEAAWAQALDDVLSRPELRAKLREAGLKRASEFTWEQTARALMPLYDRLFSRPT
jgi:glycosyltransferase involved in cell wall biosynthesis